MNFDEWLDLTRTFAAVNYPGRALESVRLYFLDGKRMDLLLPDDQPDTSPERHAVEKAIVATLEAAGVRLTHKELKIRVTKATHCSLPTFNRYLRRLKDDDVIDITPEGYMLKQK